jgi:hypothetical protein
MTRAVALVSIDVVADADELPTAGRLEIASFVGGKAWLSVPKIGLRRWVVLDRVWSTAYEACVGAAFARRIFIGLPKVIPGPSAVV